MSDYTPKPEHKFTFGLWTVGNRGADPFGGVVREHKSPADLVRLLGEVGAYGVNFHDNDLMLRVAGDTLALTPPLIVTEDQIGEIVDKVAKVIKAVA